MEEEGSLNVLGAWETSTTISAHSCREHPQGREVKGPSIKPGLAEGYTVS